MQFDLFGEAKTLGRDWLPSDQNLIFVSLPRADLRADIQARGEQLREQLGLGPLRPERVLHVTLCHFGHYGHIPEAVDAARKIGRAMTVRRSEIVLDRYGSFLRRDGNNPFVLSASRTPNALRRLNANLAQAIRRIDVDRKAGVNAHATLRYGPELIPFSDLKPQIFWPVDDLVLVRSRRGDTEHVVLDRWSAVDL